MFGLRLGKLGASLGAIWNARTALFSAGEVGVWYDPSDFSTMFQDSAGTTPVTAVEQSVGLMLDKSGRGNHATQATSTKRPVLSAKVNLLTGSAALATQSVTTAAIPYTLKQTGTGTITLSGTSTAGPLVGPGTLTFTPTAGTLTLTVTGSVTEAQLETGAVATRYQWVNTVADYDTVGFNKYLKFDGVDDGMSTAAVNFTATDKMTVWSGIRDTGVTTTGIAELGVSLPPGGFVVHTNYPSVGSASSGLKQSAPSVYGFARPVISNSYVITLKFDYAGVTALDEIAMRSNGVNRGLTTTGVNFGPAGTGNFSNYPLFIGARNNSSLFLNGNIYSLIVRGAASTDAQIASAESYVNGKTGAY